MAKHEEPIYNPFTAATIYEKMEDRFSYLYSTDRYNGQYADEFNVLESILADEFIDDGSTSAEVRALLPDNFATSAMENHVGVSVEHRGLCRGVPSPAETSAPQLLTGGVPCSEGTTTPERVPAEVPEYSHAGYDGRVVVGSEGTWNTLGFFGDFCSEHSKQINTKANEIAEHIEIAKGVPPRYSALDPISEILLEGVLQFPQTCVRLSLTK